MAHKHLKLAILQLIPKHQGMLPTALVNALAVLKDAGVEHTVYDLEALPSGEAGALIKGLLAGIKEDVIIVSLACHFNYPKMVSLIFLYMYLPWLRGKRIHICSPYLSFYTIERIKRKNIAFHFVEIDEFLIGLLGLKAKPPAVYLNYYPGILQERKYTHRQFWSYLTWGCRYACTFCDNRREQRGSLGLRKMDPQEVISWMRTAHAFGVKRFQFADPDFLADRAYAEKFCLQLAAIPEVLPWRCKARLDEIDRDMYAKMTAAGCDRIFFGVEHVSPRLLRRVNKGADTSAALRVFLEYWEGRVQVDLAFLTGIKGETVADLRDNLRYIRRLAVVRGIDPYLGYLILYSEKARKRAVRNDLVAVLLMINFLPETLRPDRLFMKDLIVFCEREKFFEFFFLTENEEPWRLFQELVSVSGQAPLRTFHQDFTLLTRLEGGAYRDMILHSGSSRCCAQKVLAYIFAESERLNVKE